MPGQDSSPLAYTESSWALLAGMRFGLATIVFLGHLGGFVDTAPAACRAALALDGKAAVVGFFLISGVSIGYSYRQRPAGYYARRFLRIYPLYFFAVVAAVALEYTVGSPIQLPHAAFAGMGWKNGVGNLFFLQDFIVAPVPFDAALWTLSIEVFYYLWVPLLARMRPAVLVVLIVGSMAMFLTFHNLLPFGYLAACCAWPWLTGFLITSRGWTPLTLLLVAVGVILSVVNPVPIPGQLAWVTISGTAALVWAASRISLPALTRSVLNYLGELSYPLYLFHSPLAFALYYYAHLRSYWLLAAGALLGAAVLNVVFDHWLKAFFWKPLVTRLTHLRRAQIVSAAVPRS